MEAAVAYEVANQGTATASLSHRRIGLINGPICTSVAAMTVVRRRFGVQTLTCASIASLAILLLLN